MIMPTWLRSILENSVTLWSDGSRLFGINARLALVETRANLTSLAVTLILGIAALILALLFIVFSLLTCFYLLQAGGYTPLVASSIVAGITGILMIGLLIWISHRLRAWSLVPERAMSQLERNLSSFKSSLNDSPPHP
jgi:hypothetical protein